MKTRIIKLLQQNPAGMSHGDIARALGVPQEQILQCMYLLHGNYLMGRTSMDHWYLLDLADPPKAIEPKNYADFVEVK